MPAGLPNPRELGHYAALAQVGLEMVVPVGIGLWLDYQMDWGPWGIVTGAILGLLVGVFHLYALLNQPIDKDSGSGQDRP